METKNNDQVVEQEESTNEVEQLVQQLESCKSEYDVLKSSYMRLMADFENAKRHMERDRSQWFVQAQSDVILKVLPIIDNFERALAEKEKEGVSADLKSWLEGFELIGKQLHSMLDDLGVQEIKVESFDPEFHEAVYSVEAEDIQSGAVVEVIQKGYVLKDKVIRPAQVSVAK